MRVAIMQPYLFPYIGYFQLCAAVDRFVALDDADYIDRGWVNRNRLLSGATPYWFTLPVSGKRTRVPIHETKPDRERYPHWRARLLRSLAHDYASAPQRPQVVALVEKAMPPVLDEQVSVADLALAGIGAVFAYLGQPFSPLRTSALPATGLRGAEKLMAVCRQLGADTYVNAPGGATLYERADFNAAGLALQFVATGEQARAAALAPDGTPLSILHTLMNHDAATVRNLLSDCSLS